jgi:hypothetical protein
MRRRLTLGLCGLLMALSSACDSGGDDASTAGSVASSPAAVTTSWSVDNFGTSQVPAYGNSCRFEASNHVAMAANSASDDSVGLVQDGNQYVLELAVSDGAGGSASFSVSLDQGLARRSYRNGTGSAQGSGVLASLGGNVADAALCFESKLSSGETVAGEFSVVVLNGDGEHVSIGGDFVLDGSAVFPDGSNTDPLLVDASSLMVDLQ